MYLMHVAPSVSSSLKQKTKVLVTFGTDFSIPEVEPVVDSVSVVLESDCVLDHLLSLVSEVVVLKVSIS
jgi:hypothetical protein